MAKKLSISTYRVSHIIISHFGAKDNPTIRTRKFLRAFEAVEVREGNKAAGVLRL